MRGRRLTAGKKQEIHYKEQFQSHPEVVAMIDHFRGSRSAKDVQIQNPHRYMVFPT